MKTTPKKEKNIVFGSRTNITPKGGRNRNQSTMIEVNKSEWGGSSLRRNKRNTKKGSFIRIHSGQNLQKPKKNSGFNNLMTTIINKQFDEDSDSENEKPMVKIIRL